MYIIFFCAYFLECFLVCKFSYVNYALIVRDTLLLEMVVLRMILEGFCRCGVVWAHIWFGMFIEIWIDTPSRLTRAQNKMSRFFWKSGTFLVFSGKSEQMASLASKSTRTLSEIESTWQSFIQNSAKFMSTMNTAPDVAPKLAR